MHKISAYMALSVILTCSSGCITEGLSHAWNSLFGEEQGKEVNEPEAVYFEGPVVRPGVALAISVTATGASGREQKQYFVDAEGYITMDLVGQVKCDGLSLIELQQKITEAYKQYYIDPHVTAVFIYQSGQNMVSPWGTVTVMGEVQRPGPVDVPSTQDLRVTRALQLAGGVTNIADKRRIRVTHCEKDGTKTKTRVDLVEIGEEGRPDRDIILRAGDVVWVPMSWY